MNWFSLTPFHATTILLNKINTKFILLLSPSRYWEGIVRKCFTLGEVLLFGFDNQINQIGSTKPWLPFRPDWITEISRFASTACSESGLIPRRKKIVGRIHSGTGGKDWKRNCLIGKHAQKVWLAGSNLHLRLAGQSYSTWIKNRKIAKLPNQIGYFCACHRFNSVFSF